MKYCSFHLRAYGNKGLLPAIMVDTENTNLAKSWRNNIGNELSEGSVNFLAVHGKPLQEFTELHLLVNFIEKS